MQTPILLDLLTQWADKNYGGEFAVIKDPFKWTVALGQHQEHYGAETLELAITTALMGEFKGGLKTTK